MQTGCLIQAVAETGQSIEDGCELLADLDRAWGPDGELEQLAGLALGQAVAVSWDTVLLLGRTERPGLVVDVESRRVTRVGEVVLPDHDARHALAAELVACELIDCGCLAAQVDVGNFQSSANLGVRIQFAGTTVSSCGGDAEG